MAKDVVSMDSMSGMSDTCVTVGLHGAADQRTDIHWRAKKGKASWNYRMKVRKWRQGPKEVIARCVVVRRRNCFGGEDLPGCLSPSMCTHLTSKKNVQP